MYKWHAISTKYEVNTGYNLTLNNIVHSHLISRMNFIREQNQCMQMYKWHAISTKYEVNTGYNLTLNNIVHSHLIPRMNFTRDHNQCGESARKNDQNQWIMAKDVIFCKCHRQVAESSSISHREQLRYLFHWFELFRSFKGWGW